MVRQLVFIATCLAYLLIGLVSAQLNLPDEQALYCAGCEAVIKEAHTALSRKSPEPMEVRVMELLENFCDEGNFRTYEFIPPKMAKACQHLMDSHEEEIERLLIDHYSKGGARKVIERKICNKITNACIDVDKTKRKKQQQTAQVVMDGEESEFVFNEGTHKDPNKARKGKKRSNSKSKREL